MVGVDVGGTFTDVVLADPSGRLHIGKVATTPSDPRDGVALGIASVLAGAGVDPSTVTRLVHGTTLATNAILQGGGPPVAFVTTQGFGDLLRLGREARVEDDRFDLFFQTPEPPLDHRLTFEVAERVNARGQVLVALTAKHADLVAARVAESRPAAVAICFLHSFTNPAHEQQLAAAIRAAMPGTPVVTSTETWPEMREYERAMTTLICAYVAPVMAGYLAGLRERLSSLGLTCPIEIMDSSGGAMSEQLASRLPVHTVESGGAAGVTAAGFLGQLLGLDSVISFDMGGTTAKTGIVRGGRPDLTHDFQVGGKGSFGGSRPGTGFPVKIPVVDLAEVGAGGGSVAWVDVGGALRVGPQSAGAVPGPACYSRGGTEPTVTDANLVLGYLGADLAASGLHLSMDRAVDAIDRAVAKPLGLRGPEAAWAIHDIVNANMAAAIRVVTIQRGIDPRSFNLIGFGGAGPMHAARLAGTFGITRVVVPWAGGVASAVGLISADPSVERVLTHLMAEADLDPANLEKVFAGVEAQCLADLPATAGEGDDVVRRAADVRFRGQAHQLTVPVASGSLGTAEVAGMINAFRQRYFEAYGIELDAPCELVTVRVRLTRPVPTFRPTPGRAGDGSSSRAQVSQRSAYFPANGGFVDAAVYDWSLLLPGDELAGPAIVESPDTTVVVSTGLVAACDRYRNLQLESS
jgi:N-methylhydantoinase A